MIFTCIAYLLLILAPAVFGAVMLYCRATDGIPDPETSISLLVIAIVCFALSAFFIWRFIRVIRRHLHPRSYARRFPQKQQHDDNDRDNP